MLVGDSTEAETLSIVPDVAGFYEVEAVVFDGELWSEPDTIMVEAHDATTGVTLPTATVWTSPPARLLASGSASATSIAPTVD